MPAPRVVLKPNANLGAPSSTVLIAGGAPNHWSAVRDDWDTDPVLPLPTTWLYADQPYIGGAGGAYACRLDDLRDEFGVSVRPSITGEHVLRILYRNQHGRAGSTARFWFGVALNSQPIFMTSFVPQDPLFHAEEVAIPSSAIETGLVSEANYDNLGLFFFNDGGNPPQGTELWAAGVATMHLVVPDPTYDRATRHGIGALVSTTRLQATSHRASVLVKGPTYGTATRHAASALVKVPGNPNVTSHKVSVLTKTRAVLATAHKSAALVKVRQTLLATLHKASVLVKVPHVAVNATSHKAAALTKVLVVNATRHRASVLVKREGANATGHRVGVLVKRSSSSPVNATRSGATALVKLPYGRDVVTPLALPTVMANLLNADWGVSLSLESSYSTDVSRSATTIAEERRGLVDRPYRNASLRLRGHGSERVLQATMNVARLGHTRTVLPLYMDAAIVRRQIAPDFIGCPVLYRRFHRGQRVVVHGWSGNYPTSVEYAVIRSVNAEGLELASPLAGSFVKGARVYPLLDAEIVLEGRVGSMTDDISQQALTFSEVIGPSALPGVAAGDPAEPRHTDGYPILELSPDWASGVESRVVRYGSQAASGRGVVTDLAGERPVFAHEIPLVFTERHQFWRVLSFFDTRMGRLRTFWTVWPQSLFIPTAIVSSTSIDLRASGNLADVQEFLKNLAIVRQGGRVSIHRISSAIVNGQDWRVTVVEPFQVGSVGEIRKVTAAVFGRLTSDSFIENWDTSQACTGRLEVIELLEEKAVAIPDVVEGVVPAGPDAVTGIYAWFDSGAGTHHSAADMAGATILRTAKAVPGQSISAWDDARTPLGGLPALAGAALEVDRPVLVQFDNADLNNNRRTMRFDEGPRNFRLRTSDASENADPFWDNALGLTIFMNLRFTAEDTLERKLVWRTNILEWTSKTIKLFENDGSGAVTLTLPAGWAQGSSLRTLALVWRPNDYIRLYRNGGAPVIQETASKIIDLDPVPRITDVCKFQGGPIQESDEFAIGVDPFVNSVIFYKRALGNAGLNGVGNFLANAFGTPWAAVS